jgi:hypothetical protein
MKASVGAQQALAPASSASSGKNPRGAPRTAIRNSSVAKTGDSTRGERALSQAASGAGGRPP